MASLKINIGSVNYTDFLHVTAAKVSTPSSVVWEDWIPVPFSNYNFVIPNLDPDIYYVNFYDAPTNVALGTLVSQMFASALSPEWAYEIRFYEIGNLPVTATLDITEKIITDTYLVDKTIESFFKEGFRFLDDTELDFVSAAGTMELLTGGTFEGGEKFMVTIKYSVGTVASSNGNGFYLSTLNVTDAVYTLLISDINKRVRLVGSAATQVLTLPSLATMTIDDGYYFDNSCGGTAVQVKIIVPGTERIKYNGFMAASDEFAEFWVSKGEHLLIRKFSNSYWEVILDYKGVDVGSRMAAGYNAMPGWMPEDGSLDDGDEYGRVWWWINNVLPASHVITDDTVTGAYTHPSAKVGLFVKHSTLKKFRWPNTQVVSERGLLNFNTFGADAARVYDYPGGYQDELMKAHTHTMPSVWNETGSGHIASGGGINEGAIGDLSGVTGGTEMRVKNIGVIYLRKI